MAIEATGRATFTAVEDYDIVFVLNGIRCDVLNFDSVRAAENAVLEADFLNGGEPCVVDKAVLCCYDGEGSLLGSPIEVHDASSAVADGGSLYLSKDCKTITCDIYAGDKKLCGKGMPVIRNGSSVGVKAVSYKVINNVAANASLNWDSVTAQTTYPTQKPRKGMYCYVMTIVTYTDGTTTNAVSTSYTAKDGATGSSLVTLITDYTYNQSNINAYSKNGYSGTWAVQSTAGAKVGDTVLLRVTNTSKGGYCFIIAKITALPSSISVTCTSNGLIDKGENGDAGTKISSTSVTYAGGDNGTSAPSSGWQGTVPQLSQGKYLWTRTIVSYSDGNSTTSYSVGRIGMDGSKGGTTHILYASSANPQSANDVRTTIDASHQYYGTYQDTELNDDVNKYTSVVKPWVLIKGDQGIPGNDGHTPTITIGTNGNWYIDNKDSGQKAKGDAGHTPTVTIGGDGYWYIDGVKTSQKAQGEPGAPGADAVSYRLVRMADTAATVKASNSSTNATFALHYTLHYKAAKLVGDRAEDATIATIVATIEGKEVTTTVNGTEGTRRGTGDKSYTSDNRPADSIPVTVTLSNGTVLYDNVPVTMEAGVAIDINQNLATITKTLTDQEGNINTIKNTADKNSQTISTLNGRMSTVEQTAGNISLKVQALGLRNILMDSEFRCPVEKTIKRGGKKYREAWNNGTNVTVTDTANGISAEGVNAVKAYSPTADGDWTVTRWYVPAKPGQVYTASAWCMVPDVSVLTGDSCYCIQLFACKDDLSRSKDCMGVGWFDNMSSGVWKKAAVSLTMTQDTAYTLIEVALIAYRCGTVYFRQPQLEYGSEATDWTRCADDVEGGLLATGVDIENGTMKMTGQNFQWENTRGVRVLYMDDNGNATFKGKVTASAIDGSTMTGGTITGAKIVSENAFDGTRTTIDGGKLTTKGAEMENVTIGAGSVNYGTNRQPFACWDVWNNDTNTSDNLILPTEITQSFFTFPIPWEYECNGRVITLVNYKIAYNNSSHYPIDYSAKIVAPSGKFFFEDGIAKGSITVGREIVRIMGYGSSIDYNGTTYKEFYGWVVLSREPIGESLMRGEHQRIIYQGVYDGNLRYKAFNGASLSAKKDADGYFTIYFGKPFASVNDYEVIVSARDLSNSTKGYACVISKNTGSFKVVTAYKGAPYNGGFTFQVIPAWDWS